MIQGKVLKITGYYRDPELLERIMANFRKLWVDIDWVNARKVSDDGLYEIFMQIKDTKNTQLAILNLSKTVDIEKVEVLEDAKVVQYKFNEKGEIVDGNNYSMIIYVPVYSKVTSYSWGEVVGQNIH